MVATEIELQGVAGGVSGGFVKMLERFFEAHEDPPREDLFFSLVGVEFSDDDALLRVLVLNDLTGDRATWELRAAGLVDYSVADATGEILFEERGHVLARLHTTERRELWFRGTPANVDELIGGLWRAHVDEVGDWIPLERYLNLGLDLPELLSGGDGRLASGPDFLVERYARSLRDGGLAPSLSEPSRAPAEGPLATLVVGRAFFVAGRFEVVSGPTPV